MGFSGFAADMLDRYGRLRPEFYTQQTKLGTGVWGAELDHGKILWIQRFVVYGLHPEQGIGTEAVTELLEAVQNWDYAILQPGHLGPVLYDDGSDEAKK